MENPKQQLLCPSDSWGQYEPLSAQETELAKGLLIKYEVLQSALVEYSAASSNAAEGLRKVCQEMRLADLNPAQRRVVLTYAGWNKVRISEIGRIVDAPPKIFEAYMQRVIGFRLALDEARGRVTFSRSSGTDYVARGAPEVVNDLKAYVQAYKGHVPVKGAATVQTVIGDMSFKLVVRRIRKAKGKKSKSAKKKKGKKTT